jgi:GxxExxY protein
MAFVHLPDVTPLTSSIIAAAVEVHRHLGPGLLESVYLACLCRELQGKRVAFERLKPLPVVYKGSRVGVNLQLDLVIEGKVIVEVKSIEGLAAIHRAKLLTYLKLTGCPAGLLINFNVPLLKNGVQRVLNTHETPRPPRPRDVPFLRAPRLPRAPPASPGINIAPGYPLSP